MLFNAFARSVKYFDPRVLKFDFLAFTQRTSSHKYTQAIWHLFNKNMQNKGKIGRNNNICWSKYTTPKDVFVNLLFGEKSLGLAPDSLMGESRPDKIVSKL